MRTLGEYEIGERLGSDGVVVTYRGRDPNSGGLLAIKVCTAADPGIQERFFQAAENCANGNSGARTGEHYNATQVTAATERWSP